MWVFCAEFESQCDGCMPNQHDVNIRMMNGVTRITGNQENNLLLLYSMGV